MSLIVPFKKAQNAETAFQILQKNLTPAFFEKLGITGKVECFEHGRSGKATKPEIVVSGSGVTCLMELEEDRAVVELTLPLLYRPMMKRGIAYIEKYLNDLI
jgi:hypothetical protein